MELGMALLKLGEDWKHCRQNRAMLEASLLEAMVCRVCTSVSRTYLHRNLYCLRMVAKLWGCMTAG